MSVGHRSEGGGVLSWAEIITSWNCLDKVVCRIRWSGQVIRSGDQVRWPSQVTRSLHKSIGRNSCIIFHIRVEWFMQFCIIFMGVCKINLDFCHIYIISSYIIYHIYLIYHSILYLIRYTIYIYQEHLVVYLSDAIKTNLFSASIINI